VKIVLAVLGVLLVLVGVLWIGQGTGFVHWPACSFMIDERPWAIRGVGAAFVGVVLLLFSRRR
jgi:hypothetical protein